MRAALRARPAPLPHLRSPHAPYLTDNAHAVVPFGNAKKKFGNKYSCQHGTQECEGNRWEQCAISHYPDPTQHVAFYYCMEKAGDSMLNKVQSCATEAKMEYATLKTCYGTDSRPSAESNALQAAAAKATPASHKYVPWIMVNGKVSPSDGDKLLQEVCAAYKGGKPAACNRLGEKKRCYA